MVKMRTYLNILISKLTTLLKGKLSLIYCMVKMRACYFLK